MLSARTIYGEIFDNDEAFGLFCSIAASGEAQGGWENGKIAALVPGSQAGLAAKIARHGADEDKHGRIFTALLRKRGLEPVAVPADVDYTSAAGGRRHRPGARPAAARGRAHRGRTSSPTWRTAGSPSSAPASRCGRCAGYAGDRPDIARAVRVISHDEDNHLAYCHEELLRLAAAGHGEVIRATLRATALAEIAIYRDVSLAVMAHLGRILGWPRPKAAALAAGIRGVYACERLGGWRRMVALRMPARRNALGGPVPAQSGRA